MTSDLLDGLQKLVDALNEIKFGPVKRDNIEDYEEQTNNIIGIAAEALSTAPALIEMVREMGWQPISTAPKTGKSVLLYYKNANNRDRIIKARYVVKYTEETNDDWCEYLEETDTYYTPEGWYEEIDNWDDYSHVLLHQGEPTHWMPLPTPPAAADESGGV